MSISDNRLAEIAAFQPLDWGVTHMELVEMATELQSLRAAAKVRAIRGDGEVVAAALAAGQKAAMESNGCGLTYMGLRHFCDHPYLPDEMRSSDCACKVDAEAAIRAYVSALAATPAATGGEKDNG